MKSFLLSGTLAAALALGSGGLPRPSRWRMRWSRPTRPARCWNANRAALRSRDENVPQARARRGGRRSASGSMPTCRARSRISRTSSTNFQAALNASLLVFDNGQTKAAVESARNRSPPAAPTSRTSSSRCCSTRCRPMSTCCRDQEFVRLASNDVDRLTETLSATQNRFDVGEVTRTDVSQSQSRLSASRSTLAAAEGQLEISRAGLPRRRSARCRATSSRLPPLPALPKSLDEATAIGIQRNPLIISAQFAERSAVYDFDRAMAAKGLRSASTPRAASSATTRPDRQWDGNTFGSGRHPGARSRSTPAGATTAWCARRRHLLDQRRFELQDDRPQR